MSELTLEAWNALDTTPLDSIDQLTDGQPVKVSGFVRTASYMPIIFPLFWPIALLNSEFRLIRPPSTWLRKELSMSVAQHPTFEPDGSPTEHVWDYNEVLYATATNSMPFQDKLQRLSKLVEAGIGPGTVEVTVGGIYKRAPDIEIQTDEGVITSPHHKLDLKYLQVETQVTLL